MDPKEKALGLARQIKESNLPASEKFGVAIVLSAAGLGVAKQLLASKEIPTIQGATLLFDLRELVKDLEELIKPN